MTPVAKAIAKPATAKPTAKPAAAKAIAKPATAKATAKPARVRLSKAALEARHREILRLLGEAYPNPRTELDHGSPFQLLVATILSAQSTDKGVNRETPALFAAYPDAEAMARATPEELEPYISRLGLYRNKAKSISATARIIYERFGGEVPATLEELTALPGVGRKTANVVMSNAFGIPAIAVDTHVFRVANRLGLAQATTVEQTEEQLMKVIPRENWSDAHHWLILHGRRVCMARNPACGRCVLNRLCPASTVVLEATGESIPAVSELSEGEKRTGAAGSPEASGGL